LKTRSPAQQISFFFKLITAAAGLDTRSKGGIERLEGQITKENTDDGKGKRKTQVKTLTQIGGGQTRSAIPFSERQPLSAVKKDQLGMKETPDCITCKGTIDHSARRLI
jgi:hypothetical protein